MCSQKNRNYITDAVADECSSPISSVRRETTRHSVGKGGSGDKEHKKTCTHQSLPSTFTTKQTSGAARTHKYQR